MFKYYLGFHRLNLPQSLCLLSHLLFKRNGRGGSRNSLRGGGGGGSGPEFFEGGILGPGPWEFSYTDKQKKEENL